MLVVQDLEKGFVLKCKCGCTFLFEEKNFTHVHILVDKSGGSKSDPDSYFVKCPNCEERVFIQFSNFSVDFYSTNLDTHKPTIENR